MEKLIPIELKPKEYQLIDFLRNNFRSGKVELIVHNHLPERVVIKEIETRFDGVLDKNS